MREVVVWSPLTKGEADIMAVSLRSIGIQAIVMGAMDRSYAPVGQVHVMVDEADAELAREFISTNPFELPAEPDVEWHRAVSPERRRRAGLVLLAAYVIVPLGILVAFLIAVTR